MKDRVGHLSTSMTLLYFSWVNREQARFHLERCLNVYTRKRNRGI